MAAAILQITDGKLIAAIEKIEAINESGFPHKDSSNALDSIKGVFHSLRGQLDAQRKSGAEVQKAFCRRAIEDLEKYLPIIGFIARSADLDGPVELNGPLLDLTRRALNGDARLVIASEWDYSPLTIVFPDLSQLGYVLVGMPASEAGNALLTPLAGHELGHNIWDALELQERLQPQIKEAVVQTILETKPGFIRKEFRWRANKLRDLEGEQNWLQCAKWLTRQCEESFCDLVGLLLFRASFLHAMAYLLTPTLPRRVYDYPAIQSRVGLLIKACRRERISVPNGYASRFDEEEIPMADFEEVNLTDQAFRKLQSTLIDSASRFVRERGLAMHSEEGVARNEADFRRVVPAASANSLSDIVNAAWQVHLSPENFLTQAYPGARQDQADVVLNELVLKSFEVLQIKRTVQTP